MTRRASVLSGLLGALAVAGLVLGTAGPSEGAILQDLIDQGGSVTSGDKLFENFTAKVTGVAPYTVDLSQIDVQPIMVGPDYGVVFQHVSPQQPIISAGAPLGFVDVLLSFDVTATKPGWLINDIGLSFVATAPPDGFAQVVETALDGPVVIGQTSVVTPTPASSTVFLDYPVQTVHVLKDILAVGGQNQATDIFTIEQVFSQVPEPATMALLGLGAAGFALGRKRRRGAWLGRRSGVAALLLAALVLTAGQADAAILKDLVDTGGTIVEADKEFSNFTYNIVGSGRYVADPTAIDVSGITLNGEHGLQFAGAIAAFSQIVPNSSATVVIGFDVTVTDPDWFIDDISLSFNGTAEGPQALARVDETVVISGPVVVGQAAVQTPAPLSDHQLLTGAYSTVHVEKEIYVTGGPDGYATISFVNQTFSQVPEPATLGLLAIGSIGLFLIRRRG